MMVPLAPMTSGPESRRFVPVAAASLGVVGAGLLIAHPFLASDPGWIWPALASLVFAAGATVFLATRGRAIAGTLRELARKVRPGAAGTDPLRELSGGIDDLLARVREL